MSGSEATRAKASVSPEVTAPPMAPIRSRRSTHICTAHGGCSSGRDGSPGSGRLPMLSRRGRPSGIGGIGGSVRPMAGLWERANRLGPGLEGAEYPRAPHARHANVRRPSMFICWERSRKSSNFEWELKADVTARSARQ
eukprot:scaffold38031_cov68-Phaeocystis_antarctica.AAC.3